MRHILLFTFIIANYISVAQLPSNQTIIKPAGVQGKDSQVYSIGNSNNYGTYGNLLLNTWTNSGTLGSIRFFIEFDLSTIPANAIIDSAYIKLFYDSLNTVNYRTHIGQNNMEIKRVTSSWLENTITWNNQPSTSNSNVLTTLPFVSNTQDYVINISPLIQDIVSTQNYGLMFKMQNEINSGRASIFASSDNADSTLHPELTISYHISTSIESPNIDLSNSLIVSPIPSDGILNFVFQNNDKLTNLDIEVTDILGKTRQFVSSNSESQLDLSLLPHGIYFIKLTNSSNQVYLKKVILF